MRYLFLTSLLLFSANLYASCVGVSWQSDEDDVNTCLATGVCDEIDNDSAPAVLNACRTVSPCHEITKNSTDSDLARCRVATIETAKGFASDVVNMPSESTVGQGGSITITLPDNEDGTANTFFAERKMIGGTDTNTTVFNESNTYDDEAQLIEEGQDTLERLNSENNRTALGYQTVMGIRNENPPLPVDQNEEMFTRTQNVITDAQTTGGGVISDCRTVRDNYSTNIDWDETTEHFCFEMVKENFSSGGECLVERNVDTPFRDISVSAQNANYEKCGSNCLRLTFESDDRANLNGGSCQIFSNSATVTFAKDITITSAKFVRGGVDDHMRVIVNGNNIYSSSSNFDSFISGSGCETGRFNNYLNNYFFTGNAGGAYTDGEQFNLNILNAIADRGGYEHVVELRFDQPVDTETDIISQSPEGCYDDLGEDYRDTYEHEGYCVAENWECLESKGGVTSGGFDVPKSPFTEGGDPFCEKAVARDYSCDPFEAGGADPTDEICFQEEVRDPDTDEILQEELCYTVEDVQNIENKPCTAYEDDAACVIKRQDCEWEDEVTGKCFNWRYTYECGESKAITIDNTINRNICDTSVPCAGGDCGLGNQQTNTDFVNVMAQFSMLQGMIDDRTCEDPTNPDTCTIWPGEYEYCSFYPVGNDCCEGPGGVSIADYVSVTMGMANLDAQIMSAEILNDTIIKSGWETIRQPVTSAYDAIATPLSNAYDQLAGNIFGEVSSPDGATNIASSLGLDTLKQEMTNFVADLMPDGLRDLLFKESTQQAGQYALSETVSQGLNVLSGVMTVYTAYQVANLVVNLATQCDENEQDAGLKIEMRQCVNVNASVNNGSTEPTCEKKILGVCLKKRNHHCCYNTILARIVMEQAIPMLGKRVDVDPDDMTCEGLSLAELAAIDWRRIDLSEWIGMMGEAGILPTSDADTTIDEMTGNGQLLNSAGRENSADRTSTRQGEGSLTDTQKQVRDQINLNNIDCNSPSRPLVCRYLGG